MLTIRVTDQHLRDGKEAIRVIQALDSQGVKGSAIFSHLTAEHARQLGERQGSQRYEQRGECEIRVGRQVFVVSVAAWKGIGQLGVLGEKWYREDGVDYPSKGLEMLELFLRDLTDRKSIQMYLIDRPGNMRLAISNGRMVNSHWLAVSLALSCMGLPSQQIAQQASSTHEDEMLLTR